MELFWYLVVIGFALFAYSESKKSRQTKFVFIFTGCLLALSGMLWSSGIDIPGRGIDLSNPTTPLFLSNTYTMDNNTLVFAAAWLTFAYATFFTWKLIMGTFRKEKLRNVHTG